MIKILILIGVIKLLLETDQPLVCAGIYATCAAAFRLLTGEGVGAALLSAVLVFALSALYFWLLDKLQDNDGLWWLVAILGMPIVLA